MFCFLLASGYVIQCCSVARYMHKKALLTDAPLWQNMIPCHYIHQSLTHTTPSNSTTTIYKQATFLNVYIYLNTAFTYFSTKDVCILFSLWKLSALNIFIGKKSTCLFWQYCLNSEVLYKENKIVWVFIVMFKFTTDEQDMQLHAFVWYVCENNNLQFSYSFCMWYVLHKQIHIKITLINNFVYQSRNYCFQYFYIQTQENISCKRVFNASSCDILIFPVINGCFTCEAIYWTI